VEAGPAETELTSLSSAAETPAACGPVSDKPATATAAPILALRDNRDIRSALCWLTTWLFVAEYVTSISVTTDTVNRQVEGSSVT